jgi:hypothetical protein
MKSRTTSNQEADHAIDLIRTEIPPDKPDWTENICWTMHDPDTGICLYGHMGRMQPDRSMWEGLSLVYLPDGDVLVNRSLGLNVSRARNGEYECTPLVTNRVWEYRFEGTMQRADAQVLRTRPIADEPSVAVSYHLVYDAVQPIYNMHDSGLESERMHLEQGAVVQGYFDIGGRRIEVNCTGYRDHSVSRRTFKTLDSETWAHCTFPSGKTFSLLQVSRQEVQILKGQVFENGEMQIATGDSYPDLLDTAGNPHSGIIRLQTDARQLEIGCEVVDSRFVPFNLLPPTGLRPGVKLSDPELMVAVQCPARYTWAGEAGYGWLERIRPLKALA